MGQNDGDHLVWPSRDLQTSPSLKEDNRDLVGHDDKNLRAGSTDIRPPATSSLKSTDDGTLLQCLEEVPLSHGQVHKSRAESEHEEDTVMLDTPDSQKARFNMSAGGVCEDFSSKSQKPDRDNESRKDDQVIDKVIDLCLPSCTTLPQKEGSRDVMRTSIQGQCGGDEAVHIDVKRDIGFWINRGLSNEGVELNEMKLLIKLTPNYILKEYFTKVQARLSPEAMPSRFRKNLEELYEKVYDRPLAADSSISMKFARAFLAQELKGSVKFNWAGYALREYTRTTDRAALKLKSRNSPSSPQHVKEQDHGDQDDEEAQPTADVALPIVALPPENCPTAADGHLKCLRAELQTTHKSLESLQEFDSLVSSFMSGKYLLERAQADIRREKEMVNLSLSSAQSQCLLLKQEIREVQGKIELLGVLVQETARKLQDLRARKPVALDNPNFNFSTWKSWSTESQHQCSTLGYLKAELRERECALKVLHSRQEAATSQQNKDSRALDVLNERETRCMDHTSYHVDDISGNSKKRKTPPL